MDRIKGSYKYHWNDLIMQSTAVQFFMPKNQAHKFTDWIYEQATVKNGVLKWGGIYPGKGLKNATEVKEFKEKYGRLQSPINWSK